MLTKVELLTRYIQVCGDIKNLESEIEDLTKQSKALEAYSDLLEHMIQTSSGEFEVHLKKKEEEVLAKWQDVEAIRLMSEIRKHELEIEALKFSLSELLED